MPVKIDKQIYYRTNEVCQLSGISRSTLFRWMKEELISEPAIRDWRGWRLFEPRQVEKIKALTNKCLVQDPKASQTVPSIQRPREK
jgi:hypothetical protein